MTQQFGLTPAAEPGNAPQTPQTFPQQIQFRFNGVNLGGPDATVLDFVGNFSVTRGTGANAGKITVTLA